MNELRVKIPPRLVNQLRAREISDREIQNAVIGALWQLTFERPRPKQKPGESFSDYVIRAAKEERENGGYVGEMTLKEWLALSDAERESLWNKWHAEAGDDLDELGYNAKARITSTSRQKRRAQVSASAREKRAGYRTRRKRTKRNPND